MGGGVRAMIILITQWGVGFQNWAKVNYVICAHSLIMGLEGYLTKNKGGPVKHKMPIIESG